MKWRQQVVHEMIDQSGPFTHNEALLTFATNQLTSLDRRPKLLDLRCGTGRTAQVFAAAGWEVVGLDCSRTFERSWERIRQSHPECEFISHECCPPLPGAENSFDLVVAFDDLAVELLESRKLELALEYARYLLRRDGLFVFQLERSTLQATGAIEAAIDAGFREAWRTSLVDPASSIDVSIAHRGSRDVFVARC